MTTYLIRLRPDAEPPASREYTVGRWHVFEPMLAWHHPIRGHRFAFQGAPTRCGRELSVVAAYGHDGRASLWMTHTIEPDALLCRGCFR